MKNRIICFRVLKLNYLYSQLTSNLQYLAYYNLLILTISKRDEWRRKYLMTRWRLSSMDLASKKNNQRHSVRKKVLRYINKRIQQISWYIYPLPYLLAYSIVYPFPFGRSYFGTKVEKRTIFVSVSTRNQEKLEQKLVLERGYVIIY